MNKNDHAETRRHSRYMRHEGHRSGRGNLFAVLAALILSVVFTGTVWAEPALDYDWDDEPKQSVQEREELIAGLPEDFRELAENVPEEERVDPDSLLSWPFPEEIDWETDADVSPFTEEGAVLHYNDKGEIMPYPLDNLTGAVISEPYLLDSRAALEIKK